MKRIAFLAIALLAVFAPALRAENCNTEIVDPAHMIYSPQIITQASSTLINQGADVRVVIVDSIQKYGSNLSDVERYFEASCPNWTSNGTRKANLFVVMVAPNDRQKNIFLGSYYAGAFDIPSTFSTLSNTYFKNRQWELGIAAVLQGTTSNAVTFRSQQLRQQAQQRTYSGPGAAGVPIQATQTQRAGDSHVGLWIFGILVFGGLVGLVIYLLLRKGGETDTDYTTPSTPSTGYTTDPDLVPTSYTTTERERAYAAAAPSHTTIINNAPSSGGDGLLTGIVVGEMLSRPSRETVYVERPEPTYVPEPAPMNPGYTEPAATDAPDSTWTQPETPSYTPDPEPSPSFDPPSTDFGSSSGGDTGF